MSFKVGACNDPENFLSSEVSGKVVRLFAVSVLPGFPVANGANTSASSTGEDEMSTVKILAIVLIMMGLVYDGFTYTKDAHEAELGSIELSVKDA